MKQRTKFNFQHSHTISFVITISLFFCSFVKAQHINSFSLNNLGNQLIYLEDKTANLTIEKVQKLDDQVFEKGKKQILNFGNTSSAWWVKINYVSKQQQPLNLLIDAPNIEQITVYTTDTNGRRVEIHTGSLAKRHPDVIISSSFNIKLPIAKANEQRTIYLRLKSNNILLAPVKLATNEDILNRPSIRGGLEYIYIGLLIGLLLFNLFLFLSTKDITYLYYVLYVFFLSGYILLYLRGYAFMFGDTFRIFLNSYPHMFMGLSLVSLLTFSYRFLHLKQKAPKSKKLFYFMGSFGLLLFFSSIFGFKAISSTITQQLSFITVLMVWSAGVVAYRRGHKPAKYFIIAWSLILLSTIIVTFSLGGIMVQNDFTIQLVPVSVIIELLLLSFALGDRYKVIIQAEKKLRDENLLLVKTQNQRLEESVNERTIQLSNTIIELEESNAVRNKLFSIIAHDLKSPLSSLTNILSLYNMQALSTEELRMLLAENKKTIESINNTLNNLLHWAKGQMDGTVTEPTYFSLTKMLEEQLLLYAPLIKKKNIEVILDMIDQSEVIADQNQINLVIRNLIDNAIKFTPIGGKIKFEIKAANEGTKFTIENELQDAHAVVMANMQGGKIANSTYGTANERGVGLGLLLCHEYISNNNSVLETHLAGNKISFSFKLNAANYNIQTPLV
ncbi:sensor histidine kinase [Pedobacter sp. SL55]|uniref:sensor histidine kinase n=1 Tax=Pedobacter sp. SL55 TaxID=2995161 RepID=UPI00226EE69E|nr:7TM diverse intracellular signaling domain-containing protein [Pedobacter sp. SL55]WAC39580.1 ATP-binding protein [Pedobacter sp. SL55]